MHNESQIKVSVVLTKRQKLGKRVKWCLDEDLEEVKFFKLTDLATDPGLSKSEVEEI